MNIKKRMSELSIIVFIRNFLNLNETRKIMCRQHDCDLFTQNEVNILIDAYRMVIEQPDLMSKKLSSLIPGLARIVDPYFFMTCVCSPVNDDICQAFLTRQVNFKILISYDEYRDNIDRLKNYFSADHKRKVLRWGVTVFAITIAPNVHLAHLKIKNRYERIPTDLEELYGLFCRLGSGTLFSTSVQGEPMAYRGDMRTSLTCTFNVVGNEQVTRVEVILAICASHVRTNPKNLPIVSMQDNRAFECCNDDVRKSVAIPFIDLVTKGSVDQLLCCNSYLS
ncbi:MAG: hypothetical protein COA76_11980 [Moritella sp.]|nr:MAG: hypothetical protein COA76_11980 [Moritella sp.]